MGFTCSRASLRRDESALSASTKFLQKITPALPVDQPCVYEGRVGSGRREAGFLVRLGFIGVPISEADDSIDVSGDHSTTRGASAPTTHHMQGCRKSCG